MHPNYTTWHSVGTRYSNSKHFIYYLKFHNTWRSNSKHFAHVSKLHHLAFKFEAIHSSTRHSNSKHFRHVSKVPHYLAFNTWHLNLKPFTLALGIQFQSTSYLYLKYYGTWHSNLKPFTLALSIQIQSTNFIHISQVLHRLAFKFEAIHYQHSSFCLKVITGIFLWRSIELRTDSCWQCTDLSFVSGVSQIMVVNKTFSGG